MGIKKDIRDLVDNGVINEDAAERIRRYYDSKTTANSQNRLFIIFGIFGGLLVGLGIILIIAHNWDQFSRGVKTSFAFLPLIIGQALCFYTLFKRNASVAWRETSCVVLFFAVGGSISLISQIYNIPGNLTNYLMVWMMLVLPQIYLLRSSATSLLSLIGITAFAFQSDGPGFSEKSYFYWLFLAFILPFYRSLIQRTPGSNFTHFHHWFIALSITLSLWVFESGNGGLLYMNYLLLMGLFQSFGYWLQHHKGIHEFNGMRIVGSVGTVIVLIILSFDGAWREMRFNEWNLDLFLLSPEFLVFLFIAGLFVILYVKVRKDGIPDRAAIPIWVYGASLLVFVSSFYWNYPAVLINLLVLAVGILKIREGAMRDHLVILNFGMLIIALLITCRFFDTDLSFVVRGILFVLVGAGFFAANYFTIKRRKHVGQ
ncbi:DUF2157 domain-containing protein [Fulvivirga sedimenti]|uniref:DUF2157 domain-containing protein n=1 Tax=Fulvivirga sedimenti TaxID=2879465 RepID=A0A9X1HWD9_9BACT|nr:DUF2157 domain-containing protein [Fulvivirga sedimenti]MCA6079071.1 DUF2157 domain-containing protein [Fulvivirga sedimenti]